MGNAVGLAQISEIGSRTLASAAEGIAAVAELVQRTTGIEQYSLALGFDFYAVAAYFMGGSVDCYSYCIHADSPNSTIALLT